MAKIERFDAATVAEVRKAMEAALTEIGQNFGIKFNVGKITYNDDTFKADVRAASGKLVAKGETMDGNLKWQADFLRYARSFGLEKEHLGKGLLWKGSEPAKLVGARPRANHPLVLQLVDEDRFIAISVEDFKKWAKI